MYEHGFTEIGAAEAENRSAGPPERSEALSWRKWRGRWQTFTREVWMDTPGELQQEVTTRQRTWMETSQGLKLHPKGLALTKLREDE
jgi:hypothetical protein